MWKVLRDRARPFFRLSGQGFKNAQLDETIRHLGLTGDEIRFLGVVPEEDLPVLYSGSSVFAFPSLYEGFGLPLLEAMACGVRSFEYILCAQRSGDAALLVFSTKPRRALATEAILRLRSNTNGERRSTRGR